MKLPCWNLLRVSKLYGLEGEGGLELFPSIVCDCLSDHYVQSGRELVWSSALGRICLHENSLY